MNLNVIGLLFDICGVILLWRFGLPPSVDRGGTIFLAACNKDEEEETKAHNYDELSKLALLFLIVGFGLQIAGSLQTQYVSEQCQKDPQEQNQQSGQDKEVTELTPK